MCPSRTLERGALLTMVGGRRRGRDVSLVTRSMGFGTLEPSVERGPEGERRGQAEGGTPKQTTVHDTWASPTTGSGRGDEGRREVNTRLRKE